MRNIKNFSSYILEKNVYGGTGNGELKKKYTKIIAPFVRNDEDPPKKNLKEFFDLHKQKMRIALDEDEKNVKMQCDSAIEKLIRMNEEKISKDPKKIQEKIEKIKKYREATLKQIAEERKKMNSFFNSNPKIIVN